MDWKIFLRQLLLCTGPWTVYFLSGLRVGFATVLVPQLRKDNQTISIEQYSWLPALHVYAGIPWVIILSFLVNAIGRRNSYILVSIGTLLGYIFLYFSWSMTHFLAGEILHGIVASAHLTVFVTLLTESISPAYRGIFLTIKSATIYWGILVANATGTYFHWRVIVIIGIACSVYTLINAFIWPESPVWLATRGRFIECATAHRWLKGDNLDSERELDNLLKLYQNRKILEAPRRMRYYYETIFRKQFFKPILLANLLVCLHCSTGKSVCIVYALDILKQITGSEASAYSGMLILDGVSVVSMYLGCILAKFLRRRVLLIGFTSTSIAVMIFISIYLYLAKLSVINQNTILSIFLLAVYSITIGCGPLIIASSIIGELIPLESRIISLGVVTISSKLISGSFIKLSPLYFKYLDMHGTFAAYAILSAIFLGLIYLYVPETKDKTIQEIEESMRGNIKQSDNTEPMISR